MPLEKSTETTFKRHAERRGVWCLKLVIFRGRGWPDRTLFAPGGRIAFVELKQKGKKPTPLQDWVKKRLRELGFRWDVLDGSDQVEPYFIDWLGEE